MKDEKHESRRGAKPGWRGQWYIYNTRTGEFLKRLTTCGKSRCPEKPSRLYIHWTAGIRDAQTYKNPSTAQKAAGRINREAYPGQSPKVARVVTVVTGEAARCLEAINRRDGMPGSGRSIQKGV